MTVDLQQVKSFWEKNPLWLGESKYKPGSLEFFEEHRKIYIDDCFAGNFDVRFLPPPRAKGQAMNILDLGCGIGFWPVEFAMRGQYNITVADLTEKALELTLDRCEKYDLKVDTHQENAESLSFSDETFDHVNCIGVIHHTPDTERAIQEIARVLKKDGTALISVYYKNILLRLWPYLRWSGYLLYILGGGLCGRGRDKIYIEKDADEIVRLYDGADNPLGKSYNKSQFIEMLAPYFIVEEVFFHFFPARTLPFRIPQKLHRWLDSNSGFMIYAQVRKKSCVE